ncbi:uncharacterized protein EV420DRAFT_1761248 [Desarmillaria tabescens]|uniref:DUF6533 domain-containing protein n=1 Tax=Armillaria tabescens TaxID=1929756 RepID=A0AA39NC92_ARMTA|nr:uncharacterized protein EV420DRAFT_1761248 [Desarmillaria tabescens]KAK0462889.1 hypothetical protein EV420DRAFT_1761248 [Desarmillaria tabescens]
MDVQEYTAVAFNVYASRYASIAGYVLMLYDHTLTFDEEVRFIWAAPWTLPKTLFLIIRYFVPAFVLIHLCQLTGLSTFSDTVGLSFGLAYIYYHNTDGSPVASMGIITIAIGNFLALMHIWNLWERGGRLMILTSCLFVATQIANLICLTFSLVHITESVYFNPTFSMCMLTDRHSAGIIWAPGVAFEAVIFSALFWNALSRPRYLEDDFTKILYRDGFAYILVVFVLRLMNLILSFVAPLSLIFLGIFFIWCSTTMTVTRLVLDVTGMAEKRTLHMFQVELTRFEYNDEDGEP